ncbi:Beta-barrel assembly-enhancing protease [Candidatus Anstonella stagnisolia]|nr:Beta-barrel assembly-enhancing protease [Candidatus Anstonella stagnisolia]
MDVQQHSEPAPAAKKEEKLPAPQQSTAAVQTSASSEILRSTPVRSLESAGCRRIFIELEDKPELAREYAAKYAELVDGVVLALSDHGLTRDKPQEFITAVAGIIYSNLHIVYDVSLYISESLDKNMYDCDTSAFLVFDVAQKMGFDAKLILLPGHAIAKVESRYFETTTKDGWNYDEDMFARKYPLVFGVFDTAQSAQCMSYFIHGQDLLEQKKYEKALAAFDKAIAIDGTVSTVHMLRADALQKLGRPEEALASEQMAIDLTPPRFISSQCRVKGDLLLELGRYNEAVSAYDAALYGLNDYAERMQAHSSKAQALEKLGKYAEATQELDKAIKLYSENQDDFIFGTFGLAKDASYKKAELLEKQGKYDEALWAYESISQTYRSEREKSALLRGAIFEKLGKGSNAIDAYIEALSASSGDSQQALDRFIALLEKLSPTEEKRLAIYNKLIGTGGSAGAYALLKKGDMLLSQGKYSEALDAYQKNSESYRYTPEKISPEVMLKQALARIKGNIYVSEALREFNLAFEKTGGAFNEQGLGGLHSQVVEAAKEALQQCMQKLKKDKKDWSAQLDAAYLLEMTGDYKKAADAYENAIEIMPSSGLSSATYIRLGNAFEKLGKLGKALDAYEEGIEKIPHMHGYCDRLFLAKAALLEKQEKYKKALSAYDEAIEQGQDPKMFYSAKIKLLEKLGMVDEALKTYSLVANDPDFSMRKIDFLQKLGRFDDAIQSCNENLERFSGSPEFYLKKIELLEAAGRNNEAILAYDAAIKFDQNGGHYTSFQDIGIRKIEFLEKLNRLEDALQGCDELIAREAKTSRLIPYNPALKKGDILAQLGRAKDAIALYDSLIKYSPENPDAYLHKAQALETQGKYAQADEFFKAAQYRQKSK